MRGASHIRLRERNAWDFGPYCFLFDLTSLLLIDPFATYEAFIRQLVND